MGDPPAVPGHLRRYPAGGAVAPDRGRGGRAGPGTGDQCRSLPEGNTPPRTGAVVGSPRRLYGGRAGRVGTPPHPGPPGRPPLGGPAPGARGRVWREASGSRSLPPSAWGTTVG